MIIADPSLSSYRVSTGQGLDGVALVRANTNLGTASLIYDGRLVVTAAHVVYGQDPASIRLTFFTATGEYGRTAQRVLVHPDYAPGGTAADIALVWLSSPAPHIANRYGLYRLTDEVGQSFEMAGFGSTGSGLTGAMPSTSGRLHKAVNTFDADSATFGQAVWPRPSWLPSSPTQLVADFDNGTAAQDALGAILGRSNLGLGPREGMIGPGDSGSPAFINGLIAGVGSYISSSIASPSTDIDGVANSSFGEVGFWQRVSSFQQFIDQAARAQLPGAPTRAAEVQTTVTEGNGTTTLTYFLVEISGELAAPGSNFSVDFATRDGTAKAGEDYIAHAGTLVFYPGERSAVILVEIISDWRPEPREEFYLDIFNPVGGSFPFGVAMLTAVRTILDDDWFV